jgi:polysaccharide export outer membrane protein
MKPGILAFAVLIPALSCPAQNNVTATRTDPAPASTVTATAPAAPGPVHVDVDDSYVIGPQDVLSVSVWKEQALSSNLLVRPDGMISMPLIGDIQASNLTALQLADQISAKLKKYIQDPNVTVVISQIHSKVVYMLGEVGKKGPIEMAPGMTLLEAISIAGGPTDYANTKKIYILRHEGGKQVKLPVHYKEALKGDSAYNVPLKPDDTIVVP